MSCREEIVRLFEHSVSACPGIALLLCEQRHRTMYAVRIYNAHLNEIDAKLFTEGSPYNDAFDYVEQMKTLELAHEIRFTRTDDGQPAWIVKLTREPDGTWLDITPKLD